MNIRHRMSVNLNTDVYVNRYLTFIINNLLAAVVTLKLIIRLLRKIVIIQVRICCEASYQFAEMIPY